MIENLREQLKKDITFIINKKNSYKDFAEFEWEYNRLGHSLYTIFINNSWYEIGSSISITKAEEMLQFMNSGIKLNYILNRTFQEDSIFGDLLTYFTKNGFSTKETFDIICKYDEIIKSVSIPQKDVIFERICEIYEH